jgi:hypothetical protein
MGIRDQAKRIAAGASVAIATSGLSSCNDNGAVDPPPPPLQCNTVSMGETLRASATRNADSVTVSVRTTLGYEQWVVDRVTAVSGATISNIALPAARSRDALEVVLELATDSTTMAAFTVEATLYGLANETCAVKRTFFVTISQAGVQVTLSDVDPLPLAARQRAEIVLVHQDGRAVELQARTPFRGEREARWTVTDGELDASTGDSVRWTLPPAPGLYQAELVIDFGHDGMAIDMLMLEVL